MGPERGEDRGAAGLHENVLGSKISAELRFFKLGARPPATSRRPSRRRTKAKS